MSLATICDHCGKKIDTSKAYVFVVGVMIIESPGVAYHPDKAPGKADLHTECADAYLGNFVAALIKPHSYRVPDSLTQPDLTRTETNQARTGYVNVITTADVRCDKCGVRRTTTFPRTLSFEELAQAFLEHAGWRLRKHSTLCGSCEESQE